MPNGYKVVWTNHALNELGAAFTYIEENFTNKEARALALEIERVLHYISINPYLFPESTTTQVRRVVLMKYNTMYYRIAGKHVEVLAFFSNRQNPENLKL
jgi:plasmid stabilization system protein ParE